MNAFIRFRFKNAVILCDALIFVGVGIWITPLVSSNLTRPPADMTSVLHRKRAGHFDRLGQRYFQ